MQERQRQAVLLELIKQLRDNGSWCGETHFQKSAFFLQEMVGVPLGLNIIFYKFGPYSFDLADEVTAMRADLMVGIQSRNPYGVSFLLGENASKMFEWHPRTLDRYRTAVRFVAERLGKKNVKELEQLSTALYVMLHSPATTRPEQAAEIVKMKPHLALSDALDALEAVAVMRREWEALNHDSATPAH